MIAAEGFPLSRYVFPKPADRCRQAMSSSPNAFELLEAPAIVAWPCDKDGDSRLTSRITCTLALDAPATMAFCRLRLPLMLKALPSRKTAVFAFVHPEQILSVNEAPAIPESVTAALDTDVVGLCFKMQRSPVAVVPDLPLVPKNKSSGDALEALQAIATISEFTLYLPSKHLSKQQIASLSSIAGPELWRSLPNFTNLSALYAGKGGKIVEASAILPNGCGRGDSPPSYDELALSPPEHGKLMSEPSCPAHLIGLESSNPRKKRRREGSAETTSESLIRRILAEERAQMSKEIQHEVEKAVKAKFAADLDNRLEELEKRLLSHLDARISEEMNRLREDVDDRIEDFRQEMGDFQEDVAETTVEQIDLRIDDQLLGIKEELSAHVTEELKDTEDRIRADISATAFSINIE